MTILNIALHEHTACVAVDTLLYDRNGYVQHAPDSRPCEVTKAVPLVHAGCILAVTGHATLLHNLFERSTWLADFDTAAVRLPEMLASIQHVLPALAAREHDPFPEDRVYVVGYSQRLGRMAWVCCHSRDGFKTISAEVKATPFLTTLGPEVPPELVTDGPFPSDAASMLRVARAQVAHQRQVRGAAAPVGGKLMVYELSRHGIKASAAGDLGLPPVGKHASAGAFHASTGKIEVMWRHRDEAWQQITVTGSDTSVFLTGVKHDDRVVVKARAVIPGFGVGPWVFAGAAVDAPASIGTGQLAANAATVAIEDFVSAGTLTAPGAAEVLDTIVSCSWTNDTGATVPVQTEVAVRGYYSGGSGTVSAYYNLQAYSLSGGGGYGSTQGIDTTPRQISVMRTIDVPDGQTVTASVTARVNASATNNYSDAVARITAIKR
jgi:hypothetical protein